MKGDSVEPQGTGHSLSGEVCSFKGESLGGSTLAKVKQQLALSLVDTVREQYGDF